MKDEITNFKPRCYNCANWVNPRAYLVFHGWCDFRFEMRREGKILYLLLPKETPSDFLCKHYVYKDHEALMREDNKSQVAEQETAPHQIGSSICFGKYKIYKDTDKCQSCLDLYSCRIKFILS